MVRRFQLMEPERGLRPRLARATARLRDGLLRDNKIIPPVLGALALIVFAWIVAGALIDDPGEGGGRREVANQANQPSQQAAQNPEGAQGGGGSETPAPSVENRDAESYAAFEQKDPFRDLFEEPSAGAGGDQYDDDGGGGADGGNDGGGGAGDDQYGGDGSGDGSGGGDDGDFMDQTFPGDPGFGDGGGDGTGGGGPGGGDDGLFDSGGNLAP